VEIIIESLSLSLFLSLSLSLDKDKCVINVVLANEYYKKITMKEKIKIRKKGNIYSLSCINLSVTLELKL